MKSYLLYKNLTQGLQDVYETVKTVEKISASSLHTLKQSVINLDIYINELSNTIQRLILFCDKTKFCDKTNNILIKDKNINNDKILIIITGNKGLVGGLWHKIINDFLENKNQYNHILIQGLKGKKYLNEERIKTTMDPIPNLLDKIERKKINQVLDLILKKYKHSKIDILYPKFISIVEQIPQFTQFKPFKSIHKKETENMPGMPIFEPSKKKILNILIKKYIDTFFYKIILESKLSELAARTISMEHAASKTKELIKQTTLRCFKDRRLFITQKQIESFTVHKNL